MKANNTVNPLRWRFGTTIQSELRGIFIDNTIVFFSLSFLLLPFYILSNTGMVVKNAEYAFAGRRGNSLMRYKWRNTYFAHSYLAHLLPHPLCLS